MGLTGQLNRGLEIPVATLAFLPVGFVLRRVLRPAHWLRSHMVAKRWGKEGRRSVLGDIFEWL